MSEPIFQMQDMLQHNRQQAILNALLLDVRGAYRYLHRNKKIRATYRLAEQRRDHGHRQ